MNTDKVTRVEVIDHQSNPTVGRAYVKTDCKDVSISIQDDGRTLKIFIGSGGLYNKKEDYLDPYYEKHGYEYYNETYNSTEVPESTREELIIKLIENLKSSWEPKTKKRDGYGYHGSNKGDYLEYTVYFNPYEADWTTDEDQAFKGYIFKHISDVMFDIKIKKR